jgi:poly(A) polymerase
VVRRSGRRHRCRRARGLRAATGGAGAAELAWRHGAEEARAALALRAALTGSPLPEGLEAAVERGTRATFPVKPADLMPAYTGAALGARLARLEQAWIASGMEATRARLLSLPDD